MEGAAAWMGGPSFATFTLVLLSGAMLAMGSMLLVPASATGLGAFAETFKVWCFGYDPATGSMEWMYVVTMLFGPVPLMVSIVLIWWAPLRGAARGGARQFLAPAGAALAILVACVVAFAAMRPTTAAASSLPFPADDLRTALPMPDITLTDQAGRTVDLRDLRGDVVLLTAVYARCGSTCPMILQEAKRLVGGLPSGEAADLRFVALTMDPEHDTREVLAQLAKAHGLDPAFTSLLSGSPETVDPLLDRLGFTRERDPASGAISHANLFLLIDREGRLAYRFTLGEQQERWMSEALRILLGEDRARS